MASAFFYQIVSQIPFFMLCGALAGFLAGLLGIGGGIVLVPALYYGYIWLGYSPEYLMHLAIGTSFAVIVPTGSSSVRAHLKRQSVDVDLVKKIGVGVLLGVLCGTQLAQNLSGRELQAIFACAIFILALVMISNPSRFSFLKAPPGPAINGVAGIFIGGLSTLMGIGGATLSVPYMSLCNVSIHKAIGTASALGLVISVPALVGYVFIGLDHNIQSMLPPLSLGYVSVPAALIIIPVSVCFAPIGAKAAHSVSVNKLRLIFSFFMIFVSFKMILEVFS